MALRGIDTVRCIRCHCKVLCHLAWCCVHGLRRLSWLWVMLGCSGCVDCMTSVTIYSDRTVGLCNRGHWKAVGRKRRMGVFYRGMRLHHAKFTSGYKQTCMRSKAIRDRDTQVLRSRKRRH